MGNVKVANYEEKMEQTCSGDVIKVVEYQKDISCSRNYTLYKIQKVLDRTDSNKIMYEYVMLAEGDKFPILLTEELAKNVIADNNLGGCIAYNVWLNRYK